MQDTQGKNNVQTLFGAFQSPTDYHIRSLLDAVQPESLSPMFGFVFDGLNQAGIVDSFRHINQISADQWVDLGLKVFPERPPEPGQIR